jgi:hypothetical protein
LVAVGEIVHFYRHEAGKAKYYLCVSRHGHYVYLNTHKKYRPSSFVVDCSRLPLEPSKTGKSEVSCSEVMHFSDVQLARFKAKSCGHVDKAFLMDLVEFAETCDALSPEHAEYLIDGISEAV